MNPPTPKRLVNHTIKAPLKSLQKARNFPFKSQPYVIGITSMEYHKGHNWFRTLSSIVFSKDQLQYKYLTSPSATLFPWKYTWQTKAPFKAAFFVWTTTLDKILTMDNLRKRRVMVLGWCCTCKKDAN